MYFNIPFLFHKISEANGNAPTNFDMTKVIIIISGGFVIGIILVVFASYIAKRRRRNKERRKGLLREKYFSADDNDGADTPLRGNGYKKDARTGK